MKTRKSSPLFLSALLIGLALLIGACSPAAPAEPEGQLVAIDFAQVEVGLGSPTPVTVTIDMRYPSTCAQMSSITQQVVKDGDATKIVIEVRTMDMGDICNADELSFRMVLPLNAVAMPKGVYVVEVNGMDAGSFEFQN